MRRSPRQRRARDTVTAILDAAVRIAGREGLAALTTNRIAAVAGVSIGSVYQYFPDKQAIYAALHDRHVDEVSRLVERTLVEHAAAPIAGLVRALVEAVIEAHGAHPELDGLLALAPSTGKQGKAAPSLASRLDGALRLALAAHRPARADSNARIFTVATLIDSLGHAAALRRPAGVSLAAAKAEAVRVVLAYLAAG